MGGAQRQQCRVRRVHGVWGCLMLGSLPASKGIARDYIADKALCGVCLAAWLSVKQLEVVSHSVLNSRLRSSPLE